MMHFPTKPAVTCMLMMALFIATISTTTAESQEAPLCSEHNGNGNRRVCSKTPGCYYKKINKVGLCKPVPTTTGECEVHKKRKLCVQNGCDWNRDDQSCSLPPTNVENKAVYEPIITHEYKDVSKDEIFEAIVTDEYKDVSKDKIKDEIEEEEEQAEDQDLVDWDDNEAQHMAKDGNKFLETLIGEKADLAMEKIRQKFGDYFRVAKCPDELEKCLDRMMDNTRIRMFVDDADLVEDGWVG